MSQNFLDVRVYEEGCELVATYVAEQVHINADTATAHIIKSNGETITIPFKYGVQEIQVSFSQFFRSYIYENGKVLEKREPTCKGSV